MKTFGAQVVRFNEHLKPPNLRGLGVEALLPLEDPAARAATRAFYRKFFADRSPRTFVIGINPGRFGGGTTGIPFTDPVSLERQCGIANAFPKRRELSAEFVERFIERMGGPGAFYGSFFITAASPIGFTRNGTNWNYYDDPRLLKVMTPFIVQSMETQLAFGGRRDVAIVLGTGRNFAFLQRLNEEHRFFKRLVPIEHPRYIMQYRRKKVGAYLRKYEATFRAAAASPE